MPATGRKTQNSRKKFPSSENTAAATPATPSRITDFTGFTTSIEDDKIVEDDIEFRKFMLTSIKKIQSDLKESSDIQRRTLSRLDKIEATQNEIEKALEYTESEVEDLRKDMGELRKQLSDLQCKITIAKKQLHETKEDQIRQERHSRSFNIRIGGVTEQRNENALEITSDLLRSKFDISSQEIENAHRTGVKSSSKPRHIIVRLHNRPKKFEILRKARVALEGSGLFITSDMPREDFEKKKQVGPIMAAARKENKSVSFRNGKLYIDGQEFRPKPTTFSID